MPNRSSKAAHSQASELNHDSYVIGCSYFEAGKFSQALTAFRDAANYWPEDPEAWMAVGNCYDELGRPKQAEKAFRTGLQFAQGERKESIIYNLGNALLDQGRYKDAISVYETLVPGTEIWRSAQLNIVRAEDKM